MRKILHVHLQRHSVAYVALFVALGGTSYAVSSLPPNSVDTRAIQNGAVKAEKVGRLPAVSAFTNTTNQRLTDGVWGAVRLEREVFDLARMHSSGENDTRIVAPRTGTYVVHGAAIFQPDVCCGRRLAEIRLTRNQGSVTGIDRGHADLDGGRAHVSGIVRMQAGDYVELIALATSNVTLGVGAPACRRVCGRLTSHPRPGVRA